MKSVSSALMIFCHPLTLFLAFKCTHCEKYFNRHDNLLQHLKIHREPHETPPLQSLRILSPQYMKEAQVCASPRAESPIEGPASPAPTSLQRQTPSSYCAYSAPYSIPAEPTSLITDMAVSSLRTVLPHSPTESRMPPSPRQYCSWHLYLHSSKSYMLAYSHILASIRPLWWNT